MACTACNNCGGEYEWNWIDAFDKFGFNDGDGQVETPLVASALMEAGFEVELDGWGMHNDVITSIKGNGVEMIPYNDPEYTFGYSDPSLYFPEEIVVLLDELFPPTD